MYLRKIRPKTTCLYSDASMLPRNTSAAFQISCSKPTSAPLILDNLHPSVLNTLLVLRQHPSCYGSFPAESFSNSMTDETSTQKQFCTNMFDEDRPRSHPYSSTARRPQHGHRKEYTSS